MVFTISRFLMLRHLQIARIPCCHASAPSPHTLDYCVGNLVALWFRILMRFFRQHSYRKRSYIRLYTSQGPPKKVMVKAVVTLLVVLLRFQNMIRLGPQWTPDKCNKCIGVSSKLCMGVNASEMCLKDQTGQLSCCFSIVSLVEDKMKPHHTTNSSYQALNWFVFLIHIGRSMWASIVCVCICIKGSGTYPCTLLSNRFLTELDKKTKKNTIAFARAVRSSRTQSYTVGVLYSRRRLDWDGLVSYLGH